MSYSEANRKSLIKCTHPTLNVCLHPTKARPMMRLSLSVVCPLAEEGERVASSCLCALKKRGEEEY